MGAILIVYAFLFACLMLCSYQKKYSKYYLLTKTLTSFVFLVVAIWIMVEKGHHVIWMLGIIGCFLGDVLLGVREQKSDERFFLPGLIAFVLGHCMFVVVLSQQIPFGVKDLIFPIISMLVVSVLVKIEGVDTRKMDVALYVYAFIISLMVSKGVEFMLMDAHYLLLGIGSVLFFISDAILFFIYFYNKRIKILKFLNLFTYYLAVLAMACTTFL